MPKIEVLTTYVTKPPKGKERVYDPGSVVEVDDAEAARLVERGLARSVDPQASAKAEADAKAAAEAAQKAEAEAKAKAEADAKAAAEAEAEAQARAAEAVAPAGSQLPLGAGDAPGT